MADDSRQFQGDLSGGQDDIDPSSNNGASWHAIVFCCFVLGKGEATLSLDCLEPQRSIGGGSRENHPDGTTALIFCQGGQKMIDGPVLARGLRTR
jgi:hypothetical protein